MPQNMPGAEPQAIAFLGASGSHPATIARLAAFVRERDPGVPVIVWDMTGFDRRGSARYEIEGAKVIKPLPQHVRMASRFRTPAPNMIVSGGTRAYRRLIAYFRDQLRTQRIAVVFLCYCRGYPEQALMIAAKELGVRTAVIDEGPFSLPLTGRSAETGNPAKRTALALVRRFGLLPTRDLTGETFDRIFITSEGRARQLVESGVAEGPMQVVGTPRFDDLADTTQIRSARAVARPDFDVLWIHQPLRSDGTIQKDEVDRAEAVLAEGIAAFAAGYDRRVRIALRVHPRTRETEKRRVLDFLGQKGLEVFFASGPLYEEFTKVDFAVGLYSTVLLEAAVCGIPTSVARLRPAAFAEPAEGIKAEYITELGLPVADTAGDVTELLQRASGSEDIVDLETLIWKQMGPLEGTGTSTIADWLIEQTRGN